MRGEALACLGSLGIDAAVLRIEDEDVAVLALGRTLLVSILTSHQCSRPAIGAAA